jgi:hypothetical protein
MVPTYLEFGKVRRDGWKGTTFPIVWALAHAAGVNSRRGQVQYNTDLSSTNWLNLGGSVTASNTILSASDSMTNSQCFYHIMLLQ